MRLYLAEFAILLICCCAARVLQRDQPIKHSLSRLNSTANGKVSAQRNSETIAAGTAITAAGAAYAAAIMQMSATTENVKTIMDVTSMQTGNSFFMSILYHNLRLVRRVLRNYGKIDKTP